MSNPHAMTWSSSTSKLRAICAQRALATLCQTHYLRRRTRRKASAPTRRKPQALREVPALGTLQPLLSRGVRSIVPSGTQALTIVLHS
jgi:hypothetical protein